MSKLKEKAFWIVSGDVTGRGLAFLTTLYLASTLGPTLYGLITVAVSVLGYATWFSDLGLISIGTRETAKIPEKRTFRLTEIFRMKLFLGVVILALASLVIFLIQIETTQKQVILGYLFSIIPYVFLMEWFFSGKQEFSKIALSKVLNGAVYFLLVIFFVNSADDIALVPVLYAAGITIASLTLATFAFRGRPFPLPSRGLHIYKDLLRTSSLLGTGKFFAQMIQLLPPLVIGAVLSLREAGLYGAAFKIVIIAMMIDRVFVNLLLPNLSSIWSIDKVTASLRVDTVYRLVTAGGALIAMFIAISAEQLISFLYTPEYSQSVVLLQILSILIAFTFINSLFSFGLIATGKDKAYFKATLIGGCVSGFVILLFAFFGNSISVAASVAIAEMIITACTFYGFRKTIPLNYLRPVLLSYPLAIILFAITFYIPLMPVVNAFLASAVFVTFVLFMNILTRDQLEWIKSKLWA